VNGARMRRSMGIRVGLVVGVIAVGAGVLTVVNSQPSPTPQDVASAEPTAPVTDPVISDWDVRYGNTPLPAP